MTFSIVAFDQRTGEFGVATATGGPAVGALVPHAAPGSGAIATQGHTTNPFFAIEGLQRLARGQTAPQALAEMVSADHEAHLRQCIVIDAHGQTAHHCGTGLGAETGVYEGHGFAVAGNLLASLDVIEAMRATFEQQADLALADRLLDALKSGQRAGGDRRGTRSAALKVFGQRTYAETDIRADWSDHPLTDLERVLKATRQEEYSQFFKRLRKN